MRLVLRNADASSSNFEMLMPNVQLPKHTSFSLHALPVQMAASISQTVVPAMMGRRSNATRAFFNRGVTRKAVTLATLFQSTAATAQKLQSRPALWGMADTGTKRRSSSLIETRRSAYTQAYPTQATSTPLPVTRTTAAKPTSQAGATTSTVASTVSTATITATIDKPSISFMEWYEGHLKARPVLTKMISGGILWGLGDAVAQLVPILALAVAAGSVAEIDSSNSCTDTSDSNKQAATLTTSSSSSATNFAYDWMRTGRAVFYGCIIHAPLAHTHYNFLEWLTRQVGLASSTWGMPLFKAFMEQFVYWSWFSNALYHGSMGVLQGTVHNASDAYQRIAAVFWETQKTLWVFWIPIQLVNFSITPVRHQLNVVLLTSVVWTALLSA